MLIDQKLSFFAMTSESITSFSAYDTNEVNIAKTKVITIMPNNQIDLARAKYQIIENKSFGKSMVFFIITPLKRVKHQQH